MIAALKKEIVFFLDTLEGLRRRRTGSCSCYEGRHGRLRIRVIRTGVGRAVVDPSLYGGCSLVVSTGFCGALSPLLVRGDFIVSTAVISGMIEKKIALTAGMRESLERAALETGAILRFGTTFTAGRVIRTAEEKEALHETWGALSVEMEDFQRLERAEIQGLPFLSLRVVLDAQDDRIPSFRSAARIPADAVDLLKGVKNCARSLASLLTRFVEKFEMV